MHIINATIDVKTLTSIAFTKNNMYLEKTFILFYYLVIY